MKTLLNLYIDAEVKETAKLKGINLSRVFEEALREKITDSKELSIEQLKQNNLILTVKLQEANEKIEQLKRKEKPSGEIRRILIPICE